MNWLFLLAGVAIFWVSQTAAALFSNYRRVRQMGLPIVISPVDPRGLVWAASYKHLIPLIERLPSKWRRFTRYAFFGWSFHDRYASQNEMGDAFLLVSPGKNDLFVSEAGAVDMILSSSKDYPKATELYRKSHCRKALAYSESAKQEL
jgi:hypothetical protein